MAFRSAVSAVKGSTAYTYMEKLPAVQGCIAMFQRYDGPVSPSVQGGKDYFVEVLKGMGTVELRHIAGIDVEMARKNPTWAMQHLAKYAFSQLHGTMEGLKTTMNQLTVASVMLMTAAFTHHYSGTRNKVQAMTREVLAELEERAREAGASGARAAASSSSGLLGRLFHV